MCNADGRGRMLPSVEPAWKTVAGPVHVGRGLAAISTGWASRSPARERLIPNYGIAPGQDGTGLLSVSRILHAGDASRRLVHQSVRRPIGSPRRFYCGSTAFVALTGLVGFAVAGGSALWVGLIVVRSLLGLANAPLHPASARMVSLEVPPPSRALANGWVTFAACVGIASTYLVLGALVDRVDWQNAMMISSSGLTLRSRSSSLTGQAGFA